MDCLSHLLIFIVPQFGAPKKMTRSNTKMLGFQRDIEDAEMRGRDEDRYGNQHVFPQETINETVENLKFGVPR